ncbi:MAG: hypothetical protein HKN80_10975 [Acidimicrobiia bacterium]|nr:hypothetical protein [Acidimicrobiia bacterium]
MKTRLVILMVFALVAGACASASEATPGSGLTRATGSETPTTTSAPADNNPNSATTTSTAATGGALPTNPEATDSGTGDTGVTVPLVVEPCDPPTENLEAYCQPFELVLGNTTIVWDRWFWGQGTFSKGTVEVYHGDKLVAAGPFVGEGSIVEQADDFSFIFYDAEGTVVAVAKQEEITPVIQAALDGLDN